MITYVHLASFVYRELNAKIGRSVGQRRSHL